MQKESYFERENLLICIQNNIMNDKFYELFCLYFRKYKSQQTEPKALMFSPLSAFFLRSIAPNIGTPIVEMIIIKVRQKTIIDCLPNFFIYQFAPLSPKIAPTDDQNAIHRP